MQLHKRAVYCPTNVLVITVLLRKFPKQFTDMPLRMDGCSISWAFLCNLSLDYFNSLPIDVCHLEYDWISVGKTAQFICNTLNF